MNETIFSVQTYNNTTITLSKSVWDNHILPGHPEMSKSLDAVKDTVKEPDIVYKAANSDEDREVYFKKSNYSSYDAETRVVVEYFPTKKDPETKRGEVITAHFSKKRGGVSDVVYSKDEL